MVKKETRQQAVMRLLGEGKDIKEVAKELGIKVQLARSYKWRAENPEKYKAMLKRYFDKRKAKKAAKDKKPKKAKTKKAKKATEKKDEKPAEEAPAEQPATEKPSLEESPPPNPWTE